MYITLPSNTQRVGNGTNTTSNFTVDLPYRLDTVTDNWEVGLADIHYTGRQNSILLNSKDAILLYDLTTPGSGSELSKNLTLPSGVFANHAELCFLLNLRSQRQNIPMRIVFDKIQQTYNFHVRESGGDGISVNRIRISSRLACVFGLMKQAGDFNILLETGINKGLVAPIENANSDTLYIHTDLIESSLVGEDRKNIVRIVHNNQCVGEVSRFCEFKRIQYHKVVKRSWNTISVTIRQPDGSQVLFNGGKSVITLHLRKTS